MTVKLNHTIVHARDQRESAAFFAEVFGLPEPVPFGPFLGTDGGRGVYFEDPGGNLLEIITRPYGSSALV